jgi:hypothetical protein
MIELRHRKVVMVVMQLRRRTFCVNDALRESSCYINFTRTSFELRSVVEIGRSGTKRCRQWPISAPVSTVATGATIRTIKQSALICRRRRARAGSKQCKTARYSGETKKVPPPHERQRLSAA